MGDARRDWNAACSHPDASDPHARSGMCNSRLWEMLDDISHALLAPAARRTVRCHALLLAIARVSLVLCERCDVHVCG